MTFNLNAYADGLARMRSRVWRGKVVEMNGQWLEAEGLVCDVGERCEVRLSKGPPLHGEVIGFRQDRVLVMLFDSSVALRYGDEIIALGDSSDLFVGSGLLGRTIDPQGNPIDRLGHISHESIISMTPPVPTPYDRLPITNSFATGIRAIDGMLTLGQGQRVGIFGGSGVGKSTLIGMLTQFSSADVVIVALVGERGREVLDFIEGTLGPGGLRRCVLVVATSDQSPLLKTRAAQTATCIAEYFQQQGQNVLLIIDSLTRYAMAAREIGLANGEPPTNKGYTPSVFSKIAKLVERAGRFRIGSITAIYTVLMEGDDQQDPIVDAVRSFVDGHIMLSREMAIGGWYPPIDIVGSVSRLMSALVSKEHLVAALRMRKSLADYANSEDLVRIGAYRPGSDPDLDKAISIRPVIRRFLEQSPREMSDFSEVISAMQAISQ